MDIIAYIKGQVLRIPRKKWIAGSRDYIGMQIIYRTADWAGLSVTAFFAAVADPKNIYTVPVVSGCVPPDKHLNLTAGDWKIWLVGLDLDGTQKISTQAETITVDPTGCSCDDFPEVPPSYAEDFERRLSRLERDGVGPGGGGGGPSDAVRYGPQELTEDEQRQARENIGAGAVADISAQVQQATSAAGAAQQSQRAAATSASNASQYAYTAAGAAAGAGTSAQEAAASAESAAGSASAAAGSAQSASGSASAASGSADTANAAAGRAESAESGANSAAETAGGHADSAAQSATTATEKAEAAAGSAATAKSEANRAKEEADRAAQATPKLEPLTFTGAVEASYDGTKPVSVEIPQGGGGGAKPWVKAGTAVLPNLLNTFEFDTPTGCTEFKIIYDDPDGKIIRRFIHLNKKLFGEWDVDGPVKLSFGSYTGGQWLLGSIKSPWRKGADFMTENGDPMTNIGVQFLPIPKEITGKIEFWVR